jgi:hypothetical protein
MTRKLRSFLLWLVPAVVVAVAVARVSVWVQPHFAPVVLFPLLVGASLGALACGLLQLANLNDWRLAVPATALLGLVTAAAEHGLFYLDFVARDSVERSKQILEAGVPDEGLSNISFVEYMRWQGALDPTQISIWIASAVLIVIAACGMVIWYLKAQSATQSPAPRPGPLPPVEPTDPR